MCKQDSLPRSYLNHVVFSRNARYFYLESQGNISIKIPDVTFYNTCDGFSKNCAFYVIM